MVAGEAARVRSWRLLASAVVVSAGNSSALRACECARRVFLATQGRRSERRRARRFSRDLRVDRVHQLSFRIGFWPSTASRYVMPLYPLAAYLIAHVLWRQSAARKRWVVNCLIATIAFKYVAALWVYPAYQREYRGDSESVAAEIDALARGSALYATDVSAAGLSVASIPRCTPISRNSRCNGRRASGHRVSCCRTPKIRSSAYVFRKFRLRSQRRLPAMPRRCLR